MGYKVVEFRQTPNPDALKCMVEPQVHPLPDGWRAQGIMADGSKDMAAPSDGDRRPRAYRSKQDAHGDPLASALFAVEGVTSVLIHEQWISVNKDKALAWGKVKPGIERALREAP